jgi:hypothetical protein
VLEEFESDQHLGIAGGVWAEPTAEGLRRWVVPLHHVAGALKLWKRECFEEIGGLPELLGWDSIDETYARMRGYNTRSIEDVTAIHHREWGTGNGRLNGMRRYGLSAYIYRQAPLWVLLKSVKVAAERPYGVSGAAFLAGYFGAGVRRVQKVEDPEFKRYTRREARFRIQRALTGRSAPLRGYATQD